MIKEKNGDIILAVYLQPRASKNQIIGPYNNRLKIKIVSPPLEGRANRELLHFLAKLLAKPLKDIEIIKGEKSKNKTILIKGIGIRSLKEKLFL